MKSRREWTRKEWSVYLCCMSGSIAAFLLAFRAGSGGAVGTAMLLLGTAAMLQGMAWHPELLLNPRLPRLGSAAESPLEMRSFGASMLTHGTYMLLIGLLLMVFVR